MLNDCTDWYTQRMSAFMKRNATRLSLGAS